MKEATADGRRTVEPPRRSGRPPGRATFGRKRRRSVPQVEILVANLEAAMKAAGPLNSADRRTARVVAGIAVQHQAQTEALEVARAIGRMNWPDAKGAVLRQRFVDRLEDVGLGDEAVPERWQSLRRSEAVRVDMRTQLPAPGPQIYPDIMPAEAFRHSKNSSNGGAE